ncbi:MAG: response regulator [Rhodospirillales bacterium]|nr:response regulator [Rhodospirillales bacterium]
MSRRLLLIIATCLLPPILCQLAISWSQWTERKAQIDTLVVHQTELLASDVGSIVEGARILLTMTSEIPEVVDLGPACGERLASLSRKVPSFAFLAVLDRTGAVRCASDPVLVSPASAGAVSGDAPGHGTPAWAAAGAAARGFSIGGYTPAAGGAGAVVPFFLPFDGAGPSGGTLVAGLSLDWLAAHLPQLQQANGTLLSGAVLTVAGADGTVLARNPAYREFVGKQFPPAARPALDATGPGVLRLQSIDGVTRVIGYVPVRIGTSSLITTAGFQEADLMADVDRAMQRSFLLLGIGAVLAFLLTMIVARRFIARPARALLQAARRWREGDMSVRLDSTEHVSEFGQIAAAWNDMADALASRERELREHAEALEARVAERTQELLATNNRLQVEIAERLNTEAALVQSQKLQAVGQLAGGIAHDFNNLLATIQGSLDLLDRSVPAQEARQHAWIERASNAVTRGSQLTRRLLAFSRRRLPSVQSTDVNALITEMVALLGTATLGQQIRIRTELAPDLWPVMVEPSQVEAALLNLTLNGRDAMPDGGTLTIRTSARILRTAAPGVAPGDYVAIAVADTGTGMSPEIMRRALEPFFTTKGSGGSGLGLSQVQAMVQESGGAVTIDSHPGEGTTIELLLPRASAAAAPVAAVHDKCVRWGGHTVLLVDDDEEVRQVTADMLTQLQCRVVAADGGVAALREFEEADCRPSLVILDYAMPGMNGVDLALALREQGFDGPIILATGYADLSGIPAEDLAQLSAVLNKPYSLSELESLLMQVEAENGVALEGAV